MKLCPFCAEKIQDEAIKCRHCKEFLYNRGIEARESSIAAKSSGDKTSPRSSARKGKYRFPPFSLLEPGKPAARIKEDELLAKKARIEGVLMDHGVRGEVREYHPGPLVTAFEFFPAKGTKFEKAASLGDELGLALGSDFIRLRRVPGEASWDIEVPNSQREVVRLRTILESDTFLDSPSKLTFALGQDTRGVSAITDLAVMPHLLIAGSTGTGKSVTLNALIASILYKAAPDEVKLILIDPKRLEFTLYQDLPHLLCPIVTDPRKAHIVLMDLVRKMEERYKKLQIAKARNIDRFNEQTSRRQRLPYIVAIIDELDDLMMSGAQEIEFFIGQLCQLARAVGIHLVMATPRPSFDIISGTIKNNFSCRIAFRVSSKADSRIILDDCGAERLLGMGDMLFLPPNAPRTVRLHGAFISVPEVRRLARFVREQGPPVYDPVLADIVKQDVEFNTAASAEKDELYDKAVQVVLESGQASASYIQRRLKMGFARAARIIDTMECQGIIGPSEGSVPRVILKARQGSPKKQRGRRTANLSSRPPISPKRS